MKTKDENYTMFPNTLFEVIYSTNFNATQLKIIMLVIRYTKGFHRESHGLSLTFIAEGVGTSKDNVSKQLIKLIKGNVIRVISENTKTDSRIIQVNEDYLSWIGFKISYRGVVQSNDSPVVQSNDSGVVQSNDQERKYLNKTINKGTYTDEFEEFYREYPKSENKSVTFSEWKKVITEHTPEEIINSAKRYRKQNEEREDTYLFKSYNFLKKEIYADYIQEVKPKQINKKFDKNYWSN